MITVGEIYNRICEVTTPEQRANWYSDLYCQVTPATKAIVLDYEYYSNVDTFTDNIDGKLWYDIPFVYPLKRGEL